MNKRQVPVWNESMVSSVNRKSLFCSCTVSIGFARQSCLKIVWTTVCENVLADFCPPMLLLKSCHESALGSVANILMPCFTVVVIR